MLERDAAGNLLFPILNAPDRYFYAGHLPDCKQALIAQCVHGYMLSALFDAAGKLLEVVRREVDLDNFDETLARECGFRPGLIRVNAFEVRGELFAVYQYPESFREILANPNREDEEAAYLREYIRQWDERGQFVLEWGNDFWLDETGEVVAS